MAEDYLKIINNFRKLGLPMWTLYLSTGKQVHP
jgi:hypothetical protein